MQILKLFFCKATSALSIGVTVFTYSLVNQLIYKFLFLFSFKMSSLTTKADVTKNATFLKDLTASGSNIDISDFSSYEYLIIWAFTGYQRYGTILIPISVINMDANAEWKVYDNTLKFLSSTKLTYTKGSSGYTTRIYGVK